MGLIDFLVVAGLTSIRVAGFPAMATEGDSLSVSQLGRQEHWGGRGVRGVRNGNKEGGLPVVLVWRVVSGGLKRDIY